MSIYGEEYGQTIIPGELGSTALTASQDNSGNTGSLGNSAGGDGAFLGEGVRSGIDSWDKAYTNAGGTLPARFGLSDLKQFATDNKSWLAGAGALASVYGGGTNADKKTGYQGVIPTLSASRKMITAPPTRAQGYRPGAGGIDYGGDVTYALAPGMDPWANLSGTSGSAAGANTVPTDISNIITGNTGSTVNTGGTKVVDTGTKVTNTGLTQAEKDALAVANWKKSLTPQQYLSQINQWIADRPNLTKAELDAALDKFKVTQTELQTALGASNMSAADKYALTHGMGLADINQNIINWIQKNPYATADQIKTAIKDSGVNLSNIDRALTDKNASKGLEAALMQGMGLDQYYTNINKYIEDQRRDTKTPAYLEEFTRAKDKQAAGVSDADIAAAEKFLATPAGKAALERAYASTADIKDTSSTVSNANKFADSVTAVLADQKVAEAQQESSPPSGGGDKISEIYQYFADPSTQAALASGDTRSVAETMQTLGYSPAEVAQATGANVADVQAAYDAALAPETYYGYAQGGEIAMAKGRYLQGETDGMADELPAQIGKDQPAALSHGEFVIPADVVSHMGNGNSDAGAKKLYQMMDKIRMARTGNKKQGKKINPDKFMPGGLAQAYASGGKVQHFQEGGAAKNYAAGLTGIESNLSNWAGPYVTNMLGQGQALANMPYQAYMGPLTSGESPLQTQAFNTAGTLTTPTSIGNAATTAGNIATKASDLTYKPTTSAFDATQAQTYMNPYLQSSLTPQLEEARRQSQITQQQNAAKMTQAGAFGGSRQAILDAETQRNLGSNLANITGQGYNTAYDKAMAQFNADQARKAQESQFGATYGLQGLQTGLQAAQAQGGLGATQASTGLANLNAQLGAGQQQRGIESEGIAADKAQFEEARANPYKMVQYQQSLLQGLPLAAQSYQGIEPSALLKASQGATTVNALLKNLGLI